METVLDQYGHTIDFEKALKRMDPTLLTDVKERMGECTAQALFEAYCAAHALRFGEEFHPL